MVAIDHPKETNRPAEKNRPTEKNRPATIAEISEKVKRIVHGTTKMAFVTILIVELCFHAVRPTLTTKMAIHQTILTKTATTYAYYAIMPSHV